MAREIILQISAGSFLNLSWNLRTNSQSGKLKVIIIKDYQLLFILQLNVMIIVPKLFSKRILRNNLTEKDFDAS